MIQAKAGPEPGTVTIDYLDIYGLSFTELEGITAREGLRAWQMLLPPRIKTALNRAGFNTTPKTYTVEDDPTELRVIFRPIRPSGLKP